MQIINWYNANQDKLIAAQVPGAWSVPDKPILNIKILDYTMIYVCI
jgi:hypothetical protein